MRRSSLLALLLVLTASAYNVSTFYVVKIDGVIGPYTYSQVQRAISEAQQNGGAVILLLSTPGGLADPTLNIIKAVGNSPVPVIGFVYPDYSYAWSAGTYILLSTHVAAMTPHSVIGSCQPIAGGTPINESKTINALVGYLETAARSRGRNGTFARLCITANMNLDAQAALRYRVVDMVASSLDELALGLEGRRILLAGSWQTLSVRGPYRFAVVEPTFVEILQSLLSDPVLSSVLSLVAVLLLFAAILTGHPAAAAAAIILLVFSSFSLLPTAWLGIALMALGVALVMVEVLSGMGAHGAVAAVGLGLVVAGLLSTYPTSVFSGQPIQIGDWWLVELGLYVDIAVVSGVAIFMVFKAVQVHRRRPLSQAMIDLRGSLGTAADDIPAGSTGYVVVMGEYWRATASGDVRRGCRVRVVDSREGLLVVEPLGC